MSLLIGLVAVAIILFQTQYVATSFGWALMHGAGISSFRAFLPTALALVVLWGGWFLIKYKTRRARNTWTLIFSVAIVIAVETIAPITPLKAHLQQEALNSVQVQNISDETLLSANGYPIGIRLVYDVTFPRAGAYSISPSQYSMLNGETEPYPLQFGRFLRASIDPEPLSAVGQPDERTFVANIPYRFVFDSVPNFLRYDEARDSYCIYLQANTNYSDDDVLSAIARADAAKRRTFIQADGPTSFTSRLVVSEYTTRNSYSVKEIYDGAINEGAVNCEF
jgi:hypothetical protein